MKNLDTSHKNLSSKKRMFIEESRKCGMAEGNFCPKIPSSFHHLWFYERLNQHNFSKQILLQEQDFRCFAEKGRIFYTSQTGVP